MTPGQLAVRDATELYISIKVECIDNLLHSFYMVIKKIATNIPKDLLEEATQLTGLNQTQALIEGLRELVARNKRHSLHSMGGKLHMNVDTDRSRQRKKL